MLMQRLNITLEKTKHNLLLEEPYNSIRDSRSRAVAKQS